ncbi:MAG: EAL domain-containing protein [Oscillospiraceae bacterium]|nr:EAL domain-containing protein [Oscillospiraceae bacterium]
MKTNPNKQAAGVKSIPHERIMPYFQPIIAADTNRIYSFEVLGRYIDDNSNVQSLGRFFSDRTVSCEDALKVDRIVRRKALEKFAAEKKNQHLFINLRLEWIAKYANKPEKLPTILWAREFGIDLSDIVIEITEDEFFADSDYVTEIVNYYKKIGCRIAVDDYGKRASNIERLAMLSPDIIKIDMSYVHKSENSYHYREYMKALALFAERVGIEVLYEGIENQKQLDYCMNSRGRYYQGYMLALPQPDIANAEADYAAFSASYSGLVESMQQKFGQNNSRREFWDVAVEKFLREKKLNSADNINEYFSEMLLELSPCIKRIFLCDSRGKQLSYNIELCPDGGVRLNDCQRRNWSWRGYFAEAMAMLDLGLKSYLTSVYRDFTTKEKIYTYIRPLNKDLYLFVDILKSKVAADV